MNIVEVVYEKFNHSPPPDRSKLIRKLMNWTFNFFGTKKPFSSSVVFSFLYSSSTAKGYHTSSMCIILI